MPRLIWSCLPRVRPFRSHFFSTWAPELHPARNQAAHGFASSGWLDAATPLAPDMGLGFLGSVAGLRWVLRQL